MLMLFEAIATLFLENWSFWHVTQFGVRLYTLYFHFSVIYIIMFTVINNNNDMRNISKMWHDDKYTTYVETHIYDLNYLHNKMF